MNIQFHGTDTSILIGFESYLIMGSGVKKNKLWNLLNPFRFSVIIPGFLLFQILLFHKTIFQYYSNTFSNYINQFRIHLHSEIICFYF